MADSRQASPGPVLWGAVPHESSFIWRRWLNQPVVRFALFAVLETVRAIPQGPEVLFGKMQAGQLAGDATQAPAREFADGAGKPLAELTGPLAARGGSSPPSIRGQAPKPN